MYYFLLDEKKMQALSATEIIQEQSGSGNIVSSPPIAPCLGRGSFPGADIDLSTTKKSASSIAKVFIFTLKCHDQVYNALAKSYHIGGIKSH